MKKSRVVQVNNYEIVEDFLYFSHKLTCHSAIVHKFTRIYTVCSTTSRTDKTIHVNLCKKNAQSISKRITCT